MLKAVEFIGFTDGGSTPLFVRGNDGRRYLTKLMGNRQGDGMLINELIGSFVLRFLDVNVAPPTVIEISEEFIVENRLRDLPGGESFLAGPALAFAVVGDISLHPNNRRAHTTNLAYPSRLDVEQLLNPHDFTATLIADVALDNLDVRQVIFEPLADGKLRALMFDQGNCFGTRETVSTNDPGFRINLAAAVAAKIFALSTQETIEKHLARLQQLTPAMLQEAAAQAPLIWFDRCELRAHYARAIAAFFARLPQVPHAVEVALDKIERAGIIIYVGCTSSVNV
jgi:hypothetical protein